MQEETNNVITIVLTADNHLGATIPGQPPRKREEQRQRQRHAFGQAADFAIGQGVDLFLQAGDLFDTPHPDEQDRSFVAARLAALKQAGMRVFALGGVHDTPTETHSMLGDSLMPAPQLSYASLGALHYFPPNESAAASRHVLQPITLDIRGVQVALCGLGVTAGQQGDPLAQMVLSDREHELERAAIPLLLLHAPIEGVAGGTSALDMQALVARATIASQSAFHFILAGYHHAFQRLSIGRTEVIVAGATQHIHFNDPDAEPGFVFLGLAADGVRWCRHIAVDSVQLRRLIIPVADLWPAETPVGTRFIASDAIASDAIASDAIASDAIASDDAFTRATARISPIPPNLSVSDTTASAPVALAPTTSDIIASNGEGADAEGADAMNRVPTAPDSPAASEDAMSDAAASETSVSEDPNRVGTGLVLALENPTAHILAQLRPLCTEDAMVQVRLEGELTRQRYHQLDLNRLRRYGVEHAFAFIIDDSAVTFLPDMVGIRFIPSASIEPAPTASTVSAAEREERLSPRDELMRLADEWIAAAEDEQERQALVATKEELLAALWNL